MESTILVTGCAGFIGMHVTLKLLAAGHQVVGIDDLNTYYSVQLKLDRLAEISRRFPRDQFLFRQLAIENEQALEELRPLHKVSSIVHLAAQAGVRHSIDRPMTYARSNLLGMTSVLQLARSLSVEHFVYASSSSVYGGNTKVPFSETDRVDDPVSFYAATKRANEAMASSYASMFKLPMTGLRFFTVYGPWGRPDMAPWLFTEAILSRKPIRIFGQGKPRRDYTYIDDIAEGLVSVLARPPGSTDKSLHRILNIGNHQPVSVIQFIEVLESIIGKPAIRELVSMQPGDVDVTYADTTALTTLTGFRPQIQLQEGLVRFVHWYRSYRSQLSMISLRQTTMTRS